MSTTTRHVAASLFPDIVADKYIGPLPQSVQSGTNADVVYTMRDIYFADSVVDLTYGSAGGWWQRWKPEQLTVSQHDFTALPYVDGEFDTTCFDPPYVQTGGAATRSTIGDGFRDRYGINDRKRTEAELLQLILDGATEAARITNRDTGFVVVKAMDFTGSGRFCDWTYAIHRHMISLGLFLHDEIIHNAGPGPGGHNIATPKRARRAHSKFLVFTWRSIR